MNIGEAARRSGISAKMIRYYEQIGLLPPADRLASGYRSFSAGDVDELRFIRGARDLGFSVAEIGDLLDLWRDRGRRSGEVKRIAGTHIERLRHKAAGLLRMADILQELADDCAGDDRPDCPIIRKLEMTG